MRRLADPKGWAIAAAVFASHALIAATFTGCSALLGVVAAAAANVGYLTDAIELAELGADKYFARHPNSEREQEVANVLLDARAAADVLKAAEGPARAAAKGDAIDAFGKLRDALSAMGILDAAPPMGGAETEADEPEPFALPSDDDLIDRI